MQLSASALAMVIESSEYYAELETAVMEEGKFTLGVSALPGLAAQGATLWYGPGMVIVSSDPAQRQPALVVLEWFYSIDAQLAWTATTHYLPVRRSIVTSRLSDEDTSSMQQVYQVVLDAATEGTWVVWPPYMDQMACRASLLRVMLSLSEAGRVPSAYLDTAVTACNTGVRQPMSPAQIRSSDGGSAP